MLEKLLPNNEGAIDRILRVAAGLAVLSLAFVGPRTPFGWLGLIFVITGAVGSCPLYRIFGINTCKVTRTSAPTGT
ncbi:MAG: DUF2892 domain-containing protein, partial [Deltaproteobacteria bacterium]